MEYRRLGASGLHVPELALGAGSFGVPEGSALPPGGTGTAEARRMVDMCLEAGVTMFDTADVYAAGSSEEVLGAALKGRRDRALISTKIGVPLGEGPGEGGTSRPRLVRGVEDALRRLGTGHIDLLQLHLFDAGTPAEEVLATLDELVRSGKVRYIGASNFPGWHLMKSLALSDRYGYARYVAHQVYYSLVGREYEWELMPLGLDQGVGAVVWSPLAWGRLTGKVRKGEPLPERSRLREAAAYGPPVEDEQLHRVVVALDEVAEETGHALAQVAINWLLRRPSVASVVIGARNEEQLRQNLGAVGWSLTPEQVARLEAASARHAVYPHWLAQRQERFARLNPSPVDVTPPTD
ncbi:aldo/keto reductase [Streptomyces iconiensis]|uniref:Aldo/keto reductase n=1 Tax=Streptomyces iconiensis TaxID=1384038 RepID=A0ABT7A2I1_9ACTN|nr:aldo/keto reductase [Streptomyces iconiensis]MDJ1135532.1 aldo/keto reductase [Streptomyces iconiensis]